MISVIHVASVMSLYIYDVVTLKLTENSFFSITYISVDVTVTKSTLTNDYSTPILYLMNG